MSIPLFYTNSILTPHSQCVLETDEAFHAIKVLRMSQGDVLDITDGMGNRARARILALSKRDCIAEIETLETVKARIYRLHIAIAPTKNIDRFEWFLEKATELGIEEITPLLCEHSERRTVKEDRCRKILLSAMKQSEQSWLPVLHPLTSFDKLVQKTDYQGRYLAWCGTGQESHLAVVYPPGKDALLLVGPEGDFSEREVALALAQQFVPVNLGPNRLRTETAGLAACSMLNTINDIRQKYED